MAAEWAIGLLSLVLSALPLNGIGAFLLIFYLSTSAGIEKTAVLRNKQIIVFGITMTLLCVGIAVALPVLYSGNSLLFNLKRICLLSLLWPIAYIDFKTCRIPNLFILAGCACRLIIFLFELFFERDGILPRAGAELAACAVLGAAALICGLLFKNALGPGDIKLFALMGLLLGLDGIWGSVLASLLVSFIISIVLLSTKRKTRKDTMPFAPAIMIGTYLSVLLIGM